MNSTDIRPTDSTRHAPISILWQTPEIGDQIIVGTADLPNGRHAFVSISCHDHVIGISIFAADCTEIWTEFHPSFTGSVFNAMPIARGRVQRLSNYFETH